MNFTEAALAIPRTCEDCGASFVTKNFHGVRCEVCRKAHNARMSREWREAHPERMAQYQAKKRKDAVEFEVANSRQSWWTVVSDPDEDGGMMPGLKLSGHEVEFMQRDGCFTPGTVLKHRRGGLFKVVKTAKKLALEAI